MLLEPLATSLTGEAARAVSGAGSPERPGAVYERYSVDLARGRALRYVHDRASRRFVSAVDLPAGVLSLQSPGDTHDAAWLRSRTPPTVPVGPAVSAADLFSGCGGLSVGVVEACRALGRPVEHALAVDVDRDALDVYARNFPDTPLYDQPVESLVDGELGEPFTAAERRLGANLGGLDIAVGGPPCQGHSDLNNHTRRQDPKNFLYLRMARFVEVVRPRNVLIENVPGVAHDKHGVLPAAVAALERAGYTVSSGVVAAARLGVPQNRRRHLLLATLDKNRDCPLDVAALPERFAAPTRSVMWAIADLDGVAANGAFDTSARHAPVNQERIRYLFENDLYELPNEQRPDCHRLKPHSYQAVYGRMYPDKPAPTITSGFGSTGQGRFVHPLHPRTLTPHEAARIQGFPDHFSFGPATGRRSLQRMIGNAVHSRLSYAAVLDLIR